MAIDLKNKPNVDPPSYDYPYGKTRDNTGAGNGTPLNHEVMGDYFQFFAHLLGQAGITPNNIPDNANDGFQYFDAYLGAMFLPWQSVSNYQNNYQDDTTAPLQFRKIGSKKVFLSGKVSNSNVGSVSTSETIFTLPVAFRPVRTVMATAVDMTGSYAIVEINAAGEVKLRGDLKTTGTTNVFMNLEFCVD